MTTAPDTEFDSNARAGLLLIAATVCALAISNSGLAGTYNQLLTAEFAIRLESWVLSKPLLLWINDGLMAVFFLFVGLEIKRECLQGALSSLRLAALPLAAALGGMLVPALIYLAFNADDAVARRGWAIPTATDIAFALGILALLGSRVPTGLKVLLTAVAVIDDLGAIVIIALFYTEDLSTTMLLAALGGVGVLFILSRLRVRNLGIYLVVGAAIWLAVLKSGVHATLAGVVVALFIPSNLQGREHESPLLVLEHALQPWVIYAIVPVFAFANAGVALTGISWDAFPVDAAAGIAIGLLVGKPAGIFVAAWLAVKSGMASLPPATNWGLVLGLAVLCGIGFTMSLFIGTLAFEHQGQAFSAAVRLGVLAGSLVSGITGFMLLKFLLRRQTA